MVAVYARISCIDRENRSNHQSIDNQIHLATEYINRDPELCRMRIQVFRDEGYTGTSLNRPAVQKLLAGIYLGKIQALVVKDFSRLSRNHIQMSELRENTFVRYPVIFVSIGDGYDSRKQENVELCASFRSVFYEYYCRDVSRKVKQALEAKKQNGEYAVARVPFGYRKGEGGGLQVCPQEAAVVRDIFAQAAMGMNTAQIARWLNCRPCREDSSQTGEGGGGKRWQSAAVWRILNDPVYTGTYVWHKYENEYRSGFCRQCVDRRDWHRRERSHPAIIPQEEFERAWNGRKRTAGFGRKKGKRHIFHGITRCGYCQQALCRHRRERELLVCRERHGEERNTVSWKILWKICAALWFDGEAPEMQEWEMEIFLHHFIRKITVGPGQKLLIYWKVAAPEPGIKM